MVGVLTVAPLLPLVATVRGRHLLVSDAHRRRRGEQPERAVS